MKISLDWISDFVDLSGVEPATIADRLTLSTAEVEGLEVLRRAVDGVTIGEVLSAEPLCATGEDVPTRLHLAEVDCDGRRYTTVCGAPNLRAGMKAPFAPVGVTLATGQRIDLFEGVT